MQQSAGINTSGKHSNGELEKTNHPANIDELSNINMIRRRITINNSIQKACIDTSS